MRTQREIDQVLELAAAGLNQSEVARRSGIPRGTVREWLKGRIPDRAVSMPPLWPTDQAVRGPRREYSYLFGMYLGDGCLSAHARGVYRLRIVLDTAYPRIIESCAEAMRAVLPNRVNVRKRPGSNCCDVSAYSKQWPVLFPQHGAGPKHRRNIALTTWQRRIVDAYPEEFLRGLVHSDGTRHLNRVNGKRYPRYMFSSRSAQIRALFCGACDRLGVRWTQSYEWTISVARAPDVARLDAFIGPKG